jgi:hypothetical protein
MTFSRFRVVIVFIFLVPWTLASCGTAVKRHAIAADADVPPDPNSVFLKAHMQNGNLYVLHGWKLDGGAGVVTGEGILYNASRDTLATGAFTVSTDSIAVFETNQKTGSRAVKKLAIATVAGAAVAGVIWTAIMIAWASE